MKQGAACRRHCKTTENILKYDAGSGLGYPKRYLEHMPKPKKAQDSDCSMFKGESPEASRDK
jgi:hypothetical protein